MVARERARAVSTASMPPRMRTMSPASALTSTPLPTAMPTSATARAGASLMPSPTMATSRPSAWSRRMRSAFSAGNSPAATSASARPACRATARAVRSLSPVSMTTRMPISCRRATTAADSGRRASASERMPAIWRSSHCQRALSSLPAAARAARAGASASSSGVCPASASEASRSSTAASGAMRFCSMKATLPRATRQAVPSSVTTPAMPRPGATSTASTGQAGQPRSLPAATRARASGCSERASSAADSVTRACSSWAARGMTPVSTGLPVVRVPVLSTAMART